MAAPPKRKYKPRKKKAAPEEPTFSVNPNDGQSSLAIPQEELDVSEHLVGEEHSLEDFLQVFQLQSSSLAPFNSNDKMTSSTCESIGSNFTAEPLEMSDYFYSINQHRECELIKCYSTSNEEHELDISIESTGDTVSSMTHESRINKILSLLRGGRLSPFDLVLEVLDEYQPKYSSYQVEFYKENNQKLTLLLNKISSNTNGRRKICSWIESSGLDLVCEIVSKEMDEVQKAEKVSTLTSITPDFIKSWDISGRADMAPCMTQILLSAAETRLAHEKNKIKTPDAVSTLNYLLSSPLDNNLNIPEALQRHYKAASISEILPFIQISSPIRTFSVGNRERSSNNRSNPLLRSFCQLLVSSQNNHSSWKTLHAACHRC